MKKLSPLADEVMQRKNIMASGKYALKTEALTFKNSNNKVGVSECWKRIAKMCESVTPLSYSKPSLIRHLRITQKDELNAKYKSTISLIIQYSKLQTKYIIIAESEDVSSNVEFILFQ